MVRLNFLSGLLPWVPNACRSVTNCCKTSSGVGLGLVWAPQEDQVLELDSVLVLELDSAVVPDPREGLVVEVAVVVVAGLLGLGSVKHPAVVVLTVDPAFGFWQPLKLDTDKVALDGLNIMKSNGSMHLSL